MARTYIPGPEADAIVDRLLANGHYSSADEVVRACLHLLQRYDAELNDLLRLGDERVSETPGGRIHHDADGDEMTTDIIAAGKRLRQGY